MQEGVDFIYKVRANGKKYKLYRDSCITCGASKGFIRKSRLHKECHSCNAIRAKEIGKNWNNKPSVLKKIKEARKQQKIKHSELTKMKISKSNKVTKQNQQLKKKGFILQSHHRKLRKNFSSLMGMRLKRRLIGKSGNSCFECLGYSIDELISHLESKFQPGMTWENYGEWHIDHVIPDSWFNYREYGDEDFIKCWSLDNLQPLWAEDNLRKGDTYDLSEKQS